MKGEAIRANIVVLALLSAAMLAMAPSKPKGGAIIAGGKVVLRGWKSNAAGVRVEFQIEQVGGAGDFFGIVFEPWNQDNPTLVAQAPTRSAAAKATSVHIAYDTHGLP